MFTFSELLPYIDSKQLCFAVPGNRFRDCFGFLILHPFSVNSDNQIHNGQGPANTFVVCATCSTLPYSFCYPFAKCKRCSTARLSGRRRYKSCSVHLTVVPSDGSGWTPSVVPSLLPGPLL